MRKNPTWGELRLWHALRQKRLGVRFRRQEPIGSYIADFACHPHRVIVEVDGITHGYGDHAYAVRRDQWFGERDWVVLHFSDEDVHQQLDEVTAAIRLTLDDQR
jgi:very-short-patch-repair endonuclease